MTSPDAKPQEGGGMLPALLAGAGILIVAGLLIFGGEDDAAERSEAEGKTKSASAQTKAGSEGKQGMATRNVDDPTAPTAQNKPKLNPRIANSIVTGGMAPGKKEEPTSFASVDDEIAYWEDELREANRMLEIRERAVEHIPQIEEAIRNGNDPVNGLKEFETRKKVVQDNLERAQKRVEEVEGKLDKLKG
jgi:hypothetical protein